MPECMKKSRKLSAKSGLNNFMSISRGSSLSFLMKLYSGKYIMQEIGRLQGKTRISDIAKKFGYSERYVRKMPAKTNQEDMCVGEERVYIENKIEVQDLPFLARR